jgi:hypothetical protein
VNGRETSSSRDLLDEQPDERRQGAFIAETPQSTHFGVQDRIEVAKAQTYVSRIASYEASLMDDWAKIKQKFHIFGYKFFNNESAFLEMKSELVAFLYEITGQVPPEDKVQARNQVDHLIAELRKEPKRKQILYLFNEISNWFYATKMGLKAPKEGSEFDLPVELIFKQHVAAAFEAQRAYNKQKEEEKVIQK